MAIKDPLMFITIEEFKNWKGFNNQLFDEITTPDSEIRYAIEIVSNNIDYLSGFTISKKWPEITPTDFTDNIQTATIHYVNFLLSKGVEYARGQASIGQGGIVYSQNNPEEPYFIPPQVFNYLRKIKEYPNIKGFNLKSIEPQKNNWFNKFISNCGEDSPLNTYIPYNNIKSLDDRTKITIIHPQNMLRPVVNIDTTGIKSSDSHSLWEINKDNPNFINAKDYKGISANDKRIIDVGTPTFLSDATTKVYVDNLLDKKQDKLTAGKNITIKDNVISASGGSIIDENRIFNNKEDKDNTTDLINKVIKKGIKTITYRDNPSITDDLDIPNKKYVDNKIPNLDNYYTKPELDKKLEDTKALFPIAFSMNAIGQEIPNLETEAKQIVPAINENKENIDKKQGKRSKNLTTIAKTIVEAINELVVRLNNISQWKEVGTAPEGMGYIVYKFKLNKKYRVYYSFGDMKEKEENPYSWIIKEFIYKGFKSDNEFQYLDEWENEKKEMVHLKMQESIIAVTFHNDEKGWVWKLEELQE